MHHGILKTIKSLSEQDTKNLSEKIIKLFEEGGELSKASLAYLNADGSKHIITSKDKVLEECVDVMLCALSIAYSLGSTSEDIDEKMIEKSFKWANIQKREARIDDSIPFEIHVTIEKADQEHFINICKQLDVKPIILALQAKDKELSDVMTSSVFMGNNKEAFEEMKRIANGLTDAGFTVVREKIETVPWHPAAPNREYHVEKMPNGCYFEAHLGIIVSKDTHIKLKKMTDNLGLHLSRNVFKKNADNTFTIMATYRSYDSVFEDFSNHLDFFISSLKESGFIIDKKIIEFAIYDSKTNHDNEWLLK